MKVRINRAKWRDGWMQDSEGCSCVMGTIYKRLSHKKIDYDKGADHVYNYLQRKFGYDNSWELIYLNDKTYNREPGTSEASLIKRIKELTNIDVEFYGERNG